MVTQQPTNAVSLLQCLQEMELEEGKRYLREHSAELGDPSVLGPWLREEALKLLHTQPRNALKLADLLTFYGQHIDHPASYALGMVSRGSVLANQGYYQAALKCLDEGGETLRKLGDELNWARSRIVWIISCAWLGDVEVALQEAGQAREVFLHLEEYYWACAIDINTAIICKYAGRYQQALELYERVLATYPLLRDQDQKLIQHSIAIAENNKATNLALLGRFEESSRLLLQAQQRFQALGDMRSVIKSELNLANNEYVQGYYGSALRHYYNARDMYTQQNFDNPLMLSEMLQQMALCFSKLNRVNDACRLAAQAVETVKKAGESGSADKVEPLREYAMILVSAGRLNEALEILAEAEEGFSSDHFDYLTATTRLRRAEIMVKQDSFERGYELAEQIKNYCDDQGLVTLSVRSRIVMVEALIGLVRQGEQREQRLRQAEELCLPLIAMAQQHNLQDISYRSRHLLGRMALLRGDERRATRYLHSAIGRIEHVLNDLVYDLSPTFLRTAWEVYEDMISLQLRQGHAELAFHYLERARSIALRQHMHSSTMEEHDEGEQNKLFEEARRAKGASVLQREYELSLWQGKYHSCSALLSTPEAELVEPIDRVALEAELKHCEAKITELFEWLHLLRSDISVAALPGTRSHRERAPISRVEVAQLSEMLRPDQTLLAYYIHHDSLVIFALTREKLHVYEQEGLISQLEHSLLLLHAHLQPGGWPDAQHPPHQQTRGLLKKLYRLLVSPVAEYLPGAGGNLTIVPYGILHQLPFHALYDGTQFLIENLQINYLPASSLLLDLQDAGQVQASADALVMGCSGHSSLPSALREARDIAGLLSSPCYLEEDATIERLRTMAQGSPLIHLATHGHSRLDAPNFSSVVLADGYLNAIDAFSLKLQGCELVTLSGCETGLALSGGGDEQLGLGRAFMAAGARSLVMSIWPVEDSATGQMMRTFYHYLLRGESKVQALRLAQEDMLRHEEPLYRHPYFWAAFRLVGAMDALSAATIERMSKKNVSETDI